MVELFSIASLTIIICFISETSSGAMMPWAGRMGSCRTCSMQPASEVSGAGVLEQQMWVRSQKGFIWYSQTLQVKVYLLSGGMGFWREVLGVFNFMAPELFTES